MTPRFINKALSGYFPVQGPSQLCSGLVRLSKPPAPLFPRPRCGPVPCARPSAWAAWCPADLASSPCASSWRVSAGGRAQPIAGGAGAVGRGAGLLHGGGSHMVDGAGSCISASRGDFLRPPVLLHSTLREHPFSPLATGSFICISMHSAGLFHPTAYNPQTPDLFFFHARLPSSWGLVLLVSPRHALSTSSFPGRGRAWGSCGTFPAPAQEISLCSKKPSSFH